MIGADALVNRGPGALEPDRLDRRARESDDAEDDSPAPSPRRGAALELARTLEPHRRETHNLAAWRSGRDAAVDACEQGMTKDASSYVPPAGPVGCGDCFRRGRNEAARVLEREGAWS